MDPATISAIGTAIGGAGGLISSLRGSPGQKWVGPGRYDYELGVEFQQKAKEAYAKDFRNYARYMGIAPYALLGHTMPSGPAVPGQPVSEGRGSDIGGAMRRMGQDVNRGVQTYLAIQDVKSNVELKRAQSDLALAQANKINQDTQNPPGQKITERDIGLHEDYSQFSKQLKERGVMTESNLTYNPETGYVKYYPSEEIMDIISEDAAAKGSYYQGLAAYKWTMMKGKHNSDRKSRLRYLAEKRMIESRIGRPVYWTGVRWRATGFD